MRRYANPFQKTGRNIPIDGRQGDPEEIGGSLSRVRRFRARWRKVLIRGAGNVVAFQRG